MTKDSDSAAHTLRNKIEAVLGQRAVPIHAIRRIAAMIGSTPIVYLDGDVSRTQTPSQPVRSGQVLVFTADTVCIAVLNAAPDDALSDTDGTVTVEMWGRRSLTGLRLDGSQNADWPWGQDWEGQWPRGGSLRLTYANRPEPIDLPMKSGRTSGLEVLLPGLAADLGLPQV